MCNWIKEA